VNIAIIGLGIIGGSIAKALRVHTTHPVFGLNRTKATLDNALKCGAINDVLKDFSDIDITFVCLHPKASVDFIKSSAESFKQDSIVVDVSGVKTAICAELNELAAKNGFTFIGGHPMAGSEQVGFAHSSARLIENASFILTPFDKDAPEVETLKNLLNDIGFGEIVVTTPENHDKMVAYTSQLPHVVAAAFVQDDGFANHRGFSAGSLKDITRVADINENLWAELFIANQDHLAAKLEDFIVNLQKIKRMVQESDAASLKTYLKSSREIKAGDNDREND